jgi:hypothetical protein
MTPTQRLALERIAAGDCHPRGNNVRVVRALSEAGLVTLRDDGQIRGENHERWFAELTDKGRLYLVGAHLATPAPTAPRNTPSGTKTSVRGADYVMHIPRPGYPNYVWCGRQRVAVNCYPEDYVSPYAPEEEEQTCKHCVESRAYSSMLEMEEIT